VGGERRLAKAPALFELRDCFYLRKVAHETLEPTMPVDAVNTDFRRR
jgi:hypothetical protein